MKTYLRLLSVILVITFLNGCQDSADGGENGSGQDNEQTSTSDQSGDYTGDGDGYQDGVDDEYNNNRDNDEGGRDNDRDDGDRNRENKGLADLPMGGSEGDAESDSNYQYRFAILGDVNTTIGGVTYPLKAAFDYQGIAFPSGYHYDPLQSRFRIQIAGHSILSDKWNQEAGSIMLKFDMPDMNTTGTYKLKYPQNRSGEVIIYHIEPSVNNTYFIVGSMTNAEIYNQEGTAIKNVSTTFQLAVMPLYK